jgi:hypothetical protein
LLVVLVIIPQCILEYCSLKKVWQEEDVTKRILLWLKMVLMKIPGPTFLKKSILNWEVNLADRIIRMIPAGSNAFIVCNFFTENINPGAPVKISVIEAGFKKKFFGKIEASNNNVVQFRRERLSEAELRSEDDMEVMLAEVYALMKHQGNGEQGFLLTDGKANIFFVREVGPKVPTSFFMSQFSGSFIC